MNYGRFRGAGLAMATALLAIGVSACDDDSGGMTKNDLSANDDMTMKPDAGTDMAMTTPSTAQITVADVVGSPWVLLPGQDAGVPLPNPLTGQPLPTHSLAVVVDFPKDANTSQHSNGTDSLHGCTWDRYNNLPPNMGGTGPFPAPNENAGTVQISGYDTTYTLAVDSLQLTAPAPPDPKINCSYNDATFHFDCYSAPTRRT